MNSRNPIAWRMRLGSELAAMTRERVELRIGGVRVVEVRPAAHGQPAALLVSFAPIVPCEEPDSDP
jgi:hypothetical protein